MSDHQFDPARIKALEEGTPIGSATETSSSFAVSEGQASGSAPPSTETALRNVASQLYAALCDFQNEPNCWCDAGDGAPMHSPACAFARDVERSARVSLAEPLGSGEATWRSAALQLGEHCAACGPVGYYSFTPQQWLAWVLAQPCMRGSDPCGAVEEATSIPARVDRPDEGKADGSATPLSSSSTIDRLTAELAEARKERDTYRTLAGIGAWHKECRPNREMAARELQKSQAVIDKLADTISESNMAREAAESQLAVLRSETAAMAESYTASATGLQTQLASAQVELAALREALERRSRQFHAVEQVRTRTFEGMHGSWMGRVYNDWTECPSAPCANDRRLIAALASSRLPSKPNVVGTITINTVTGEETYTPREKSPQWSSRLPSRQEEGRTHDDVTRRDSSPTSTVNPPQPRTGDK
jgi:hypothetical protein